MVNNLPAIQKTQVQSLGQKDPLKKVRATHFNILAWRMERGERSLEGYSPWGHMTERLTLSLTFSENM